MAAPTGRKPGRPRNLGRQTRLALHDRLAPEIPGLIEGMIRQAKLGDSRAIAWCLDRALGPGSLPADG
ncbi:hypothetical protein THITH_01605 [Thioalkalivibrio paradoxus ARh 1]|uniref:Uncharacterized protein n=1 Tax=Thioalkalivibrio paradoxus ARh 1 TaxID=713585 RepID=W0DEZ6_9GAMM|nr:hypothetical protein THITH_01605 [Thioalkalivibrio paradoxus ARh 1]